VQLPGAPNNAQQQRSGPLSALMPQMSRRFMFGGGQQGGNRRMGRAWIVENGAPALVVFRSGATDGRFTQVLERGAAPPNVRMTGPMANDETFKKALERKLEPGMKVIVDEEAPKK